MKNISHLGFATILITFFCSADVMAACSLSRLLGLSYQSAHAILEFDDPYPGLPDQQVYVDSTKVCPGNKALLGANIKIQFVSSTIVQIEVQGGFSKTQRKRVLANWAQSNYGVISPKPVSYFDNEPNAQWNWETLNAVITYSIVTTAFEIVEYVQIQSTQHDELFSRFYTERESELVNQ